MDGTTATASVEGRSLEVVGLFLSFPFDEVVALSAVTLVTTAFSEEVGTTLMEVVTGVTIAAATAVVVVVVATGAYLSTLSKIQALIFS